MGLAERTIRDRVRKMKGEFVLENGIVRATSDVPDLTPQNDGGGSLDMVYTKV